MAPGKCRLALLPLCLLPFALCLPSLAGTLRTVDGKTYEGVLRLDERGVSVLPTTGPTPPPVPLDDVLDADFRGPAPQPPRPRTDPAPAPASAANGQLPPPWRGGAVGTLAQPPYAKFHDGKFSLKSAAATVGGTRDSFSFASQPVGEDADLVACLDDTSNGQVVAGLTIRAGSATTPDASHISLLYFGDDIRFMRRVHTGRANEGGPVGGHVNLPIWMRLTRRGMYVKAFLSKDGQSWEEVGKATFTPPEGVDVFAGLAVFGTTEQLTGAHFTNVRLTTTPAKDRTEAAIPAAASGIATGATAAPAAPLKRGLLLRSGTLLANADVYRADDGSVRYTKDGRGETISMVNVARILFRDLSPQAAAKIPATGSGVLLKEGDFVEGEFKSLRDGQVTLSSVVFGLTKFDARTKVAALVINDPDPSRADAIVRTTDGSTYAAKRLALDKNRVTVEDPVAGPLTIDRAEVTELSIGPGRTEPLAGLRPEKVEPSPDALSFTTPAAGTLSGASAERAVSLSAGSSATWSLGGKYRALTLTCGVPAGVLPTTPVRFVVLADGKELFRTPPRTSLSDPLAASLNVTGVKSLTLRVESTSPDPLPTPGLWLDPSLIK